MSMPKPFRMFVTNPSWPRVNVKARASGTPAKLEATPEKVRSAAPKTAGIRPLMIAAASRKPRMPPTMAVTRLISMLLRNAVWIRASVRSA